ncbi:MAG: GNAT family N-acetyltransferase [Flavobacterium sp.]|uniref:GNAT family N-acetyltransferase n=1 Tax=Flavobacterium sp. TaxID=239 RepID=UPI003267CAC5
MSTFSFLPFQNLKSDRLLLRQITSDDVNEIFELRSNSETMKYIPRPLVTSIEEAMSHIKMIQDKIESNEGINWAITLKDNSKMIGIIGHYRIRWEHFRSEIGYMLLPEYHGKGVVTEAIELMIKYGFNEMKMHSLEAIIDPENTASARVLEKNNFVKEAHILQNEFYDGKFLDTVIYSILNNAK